MRGPIRSVNRPLTFASPMVNTGAARKISPMNDGDSPSTSWNRTASGTRHAGGRGHEQEAQHAEREHADPEQREVHDRLAGPSLVDDEPTRVPPKTSATRPARRRRALGRCAGRGGGQQDVRAIRSAAPIVDRRRPAAAPGAAPERPHRQDDSRQSHGHHEEEDPAPVQQIDEHPPSGGPSRRPE